MGRGIAFLCVSVRSVHSIYLYSSGVFIRSIFLFVTRGWCWLEPFSGMKKFGEHCTYGHTEFKDLGAPIAIRSVVAQPTGAGRGDIFIISTGAQGWCKSFFIFLLDLYMSTNELR